MDYMANTFVGRAEQRGIEQGIGIGIKQGIEQERANYYQDKINSILKMMDDLSDNKISAYLGIPIEEVARIREEHYKLKED